MGGNLQVISLDIMKTLEILIVISGSLLGWMAINLTIFAIAKAQAPGLYSIAAMFIGAVTAAAIINGVC